MGRRWRRKNRGIKPQGDWDNLEKHNLLRYLKNYRHLAVYVHENRADGRTPKVKNSLVSQVGSIQLPDLSNRSIVSAPYLALPAELTSKQRKAVHELSVEVGLYHASVGKDRDSRFAIVSIFVDGFSTVPNLEKPYSFPIHQYKPWYCKAMSLPASGTTKSRLQDQFEKVSKNEIDKLIDQPGKCLRDSLDDMHFDSWMSQDLSDIECPMENDPDFTLVDTPEKMNDCAASLLNERPTAIAFDLEMHNPSKHAQLTCLLQIATDKGHGYVIDPLAHGVFDKVHQLGPIFADPGIVKIGHAIGGLDVRSLHRDFGIFVVNAFDTFEAAKVLGLKSLGLASVCENYGFKESEIYKELKQQYQACDWRVRPLTAPMIQYGRFDVHFLIKLRKLMIRDLTREYLADKRPAEQRAEEHMISEALIAFSEMEDAENGYDEVSNDSMNIECSDGSIPAMNTETRGRPSSASDDDYHSVDTSEAAFFTPKTSRQHSLKDDDGSWPLDPNHVEHPSMKADAATLRLQASLMKVLSQSQMRCTSLWSGSKESVDKNAMLTTLLRRTKRNELAVPFSSENMELYKALVGWRQDAATKLECLPGFIAPLDLLVQVAWQRPTSKESLMRVTYYLPGAMYECAEFVEDVIRIVQKSFVDRGCKPKIEDLYFFHRSPSSIRSAVQNENSYENLKWKVAGAAAVAVGMVFVASAIASRKRKR